MMLRPRNHVWTQSHHLMKALLEVMLLFKHQSLYDTYDTSEKDRMTLRKTNDSWSDEGLVAQITLCRPCNSVTIHTTWSATQQSYHYLTKERDMPSWWPESGGVENEIIKLTNSGNEHGPSTDIQCCCRRSFASIKGMWIYRTKMGCLSRQRCKSQSEINKSMEGIQSQENYHNTQGHFVCRPNTPSVKRNAIRVNWP